MKKYPQKFKPLFEFGEDGLMRTKEFTPNYLEFGFDDSDVTLLEELAFDKELNNLKYNKKNIGKLFAPIHAIMVLAQLKSKQSFKKLVDGLDEMDDDYSRGAVLYYLRNVVSDFVDELIVYFLDKSRNIYNRMLVWEALDNTYKIDKSIGDKFEDALVEYLQRDDEYDDGLNAMCIFSLIEISGAKHIDLIREAFKTKPVDVWYDGDIEDVEIRLGLRSKRTTSKPTNIFDVPLGGFDEDEDMFESLANELDYLDFFEPYIADPKIGRNEPCPCGSGKKYKKCCLGK